jgi:hypothetical protein
MCLTAAIRTYLHLDEVRTPQGHELGVGLQFIHVPRLHQCQSVDSALLLKQRKSQLGFSLGRSHLLTQEEFRCFQATGNTGQMKPSMTSSKLKLYFGERGQTMLTVI